MVYLIKDDVMHIKEMIYLNREAPEGLWDNTIRAHDSMIDEVTGSSYFSDLIAFEKLDDGDICETIRPYIMGRIVDVEAVSCESIIARRPPMIIRIAFEIADSFLPWNNRTISVCFSNGERTLLESEPSHKVTLSIATLTTLLLGYKTAAKLYKLGRITANEQTILMLDDALLHEMPYISDYI